VASNVYVTDGVDGPNHMAPMEQPVASNVVVIVGAGGPNHMAPMEQPVASNVVVIVGAGGPNHMAPMEQPMLKQMVQTTMYKTHKVLSSICSHKKCICGNLNNVASQWLIHANKQV
jgi:hypothetical protein